MKDTFKGYYQPTPEEFTELWKNGIFVLDTSVILGLYRYPIKARNDLLQTLHQVSNRIWIPHQVALEYQENRLNVIAEQVNKFADVIKVVQDAIDSITNRFNELQLKKRHSVINPENFLTKLTSLVDDFDRELTLLSEQQSGIDDEDTIRVEVDELFRDKIGEPCSSDELIDLCKEGSNRYDKNRPPGYLDKDKTKQNEKDYFYNELVIQREFGDLIIWHQIIKEAKAQNTKNLILVTDDEKEDWWWIFKGKTIGPRPELVEEISDQAGVTLFYMYNTSRFLKYAREYLNAQVDSLSIDQVQDITQLKREENKREALRTNDILFIDAVHQWLSTKEYPDSTIKFGQSFPDFIVETRTGKIGFEVKPLYNPNLILKHLNNWLNQGLVGIKRRSLDRIVFVLVAKTQTDAEKVLSILRRRTMSNDMISFITGTITRESELNELPIFKPIKYKSE